MLSAEQLQMRLPIHVSHQNAVQLFSLFDAEFYALFDGVIVKIVILQFFKICPFV